MKILHLSNSDTDGGAARAAYRLHRGLCCVGEDSQMFVKDKSSDDHTVESWNPDPTRFGRLKDRFRRLWKNRRFQKYTTRRPEGLDLFSQAWTIGGRQVVRAIPGSDVYNLHWINRFIDPLPFFENTDAPVVWTLHDMNPFTGGCHYNAGCQRFKDQCGTCPQLGSNDETDLSHTVWLRKRDAYRSPVGQKRLHVVATSKWLAQEAQSSSLFSEVPVHVIPLGLDATTFRPRDTEGIGSALEIPDGHRVILFVANYGTRRKGFDLLVEALSTLEAEDVTLVSIGSDQPNMDASLPHRHLGKISSDELLSVFYSFADLFVIPSRQEAFGQTALEAMASGTPVVGFDAGGIPDMVRPGKTGWLADAGSVHSLRSSIEQALEESNAREQRGKQCRAVVEEEYTLERQARQYRRLYETVLAESRNK